MMMRLLTSWGVDSIPVDVGAVPVAALSTVTKELLHLLDVLRVY